MARAAADRRSLRQPEPSRPEPPRLQVFISYAREDAVLGQAVNTELRNAFGPGVVKTTLDVEMNYGTGWRDRIEQELADADILLIVATGRQKLSHSFTGFEAGYFRASLRQRAKMEYFDSDRLVIPVAILNRTPEAVSDLQGVELEAELSPFLIDADSLKNKQKFVASIERNPDKNPLLKLFGQIATIIQTYHNFNEAEVQAFRERIKECAERLYLVVFEEFQKRVFTERFPERKIVVHLPTNVDPDAEDGMPPEVTFEFLGKSFEVFGLYTPPGRMTWHQFVSAIPGDAATIETTTAWTEMIKSLVLAAKRGDFSDNRRLLASADKKRFFRLFVARSVLFYSGVTELHIYIVEVKARDYGDPTTTMLLKAISVGLLYRFMFLEEGSEFSPAAIRLTLYNKLNQTISEMLQELEYLMWMSEDAGLGNPENLRVIYGALPAGTIQKQATIWEQRKAEMRSAAIQVVSASGGSAFDAKYAAFIEALTCFSDATREMNREFLQNVLRALQGIVLKGKP